MQTMQINVNTIPVAGVTEPTGPDIPPSGPSPSNNSGGSVSSRIVVWGPRGPVVLPKRVFIIDGIETYW
jgi:hypothetical protein